MATEEKQKTEERPHHDFSPSSLQYRESCAYYDGLNNESAASLHGVWQHDSAERGEDDERLSDQQAAAVADCLEYTNAVAARYPGGTIIKEQYLPIDELCYQYFDWEKTLRTIHGTTAGYLDFAVVSADERLAEIIDYKFGAWPVESSENNLQGMAYLLGLVKRYPKLDSVTVHFLLPHQDTVDYHTFKRSEFNTLYRRVRTVVTRALEARRTKDFSKASPNVGACLFCANAGRCDALAKIALQIGHKFSPLQIPQTITPTLLHDPKDVGEGLKVAAVVEAWAKAYRAQASAKAIEEDGFIPDGYQLVTSADRKIVDPKKLREVCRLHGLTDEEIDSASKFHITPIDELIKSKAPRGEKDATAKAVTQALIDAGAVEMGAETAFLRMIRKKNVE